MFIKCFLDQYAAKSLLNNIWKTNIILNSLKNTNYSQVLKHHTVSVWFIIQQTLKQSGLMLSWAQIYVFMMALTTLYRQRLTRTLTTCQPGHILVLWHSGRLVNQFSYCYFSLTLFRRINIVIPRFLSLQWMF